MTSKYVVNAEEIPWELAPDHYDANSKMLVNKDSHGSKHFDFRISLYQPRGYVEEHIHENSEQIYYIIRGTALITLDGEEHIARENHVIFIPPGMKHSIHNNGFEDLVFVLATTPPEG